MEWFRLGFNRKIKKEKKLKTFTITEQEINIIGEALKVLNIETGYGAYTCLKNVIERQNQADKTRENMETNLKLHKSEVQEKS